MSRKQIKKWIAMGVGCTLLLLAGIIYSLLFNEGRLVRETNLAEYVFSVKDIPMLAAGALIVIYAVYIVVSVRKACATGNKDKNYTRRVSPLFGLFGLFGFTGFTGFWTYRERGVIFPFIFFVFFGFFGFYFQGKLSHTLEDELLLENSRRAQLKAYKTGFILLFIVIWLLGMGMFSRNVEWCAIFMLISISLIYALVLFLSSYLLYRYEKED